MRRISLFFHALVVGFEAQDSSPSGTRKHGILKMDTGRFSFKSPKKKIRQETKKKIEISSANSIPANSQNTDSEGSAEWELACFSVKTVVVLFTF